MNLIASVCDGDFHGHPAREMTIETKQYLYEKHSPDNKPEVIHLEKLRKMHKSNLLSGKGQIFVMSEIWELRKATAATVAE